MLIDVALALVDKKHDDAAASLDVALERALATMDRLMRVDEEIQCSSRKSALRTVVYLVTEFSHNRQAHGGERAGRGCFEGERVA